MITVVEAAESLVDSYINGQPSLGDVQELSDAIKDTLVSLGATQSMDLDWNGERRKRAWGVSDGVDELLEKYLPYAGLYEAKVLNSAIIGKLAKMGGTGMNSEYNPYS